MIILLTIITASICLLVIYLFVRVDAWYREELIRIENVRSNIAYRVDSNKDVNLDTKK